MTHVATVTMTISSVAILGIISMTILGITSIAILGIASIATMTISSVVAHAITHVATVTMTISSVTTLGIAPIATLAIAPEATLAIWPHSLHWTRETKSWIAINVIENVHGVAELDSIGSKAELLLAKPRVRRDLPIRFEDISVSVQSFNQGFHKVVHRYLLHMPFFRVQTFLTIQVHLVHETHPWQTNCPITSNDTSSIHGSSTVNAHGRHLHVLVHQTTPSSSMVGAKVASHARGAESGAHVAIAHSLVCDHQTRSSRYFSQCKQMDLGTSLVRSLQGSARCIATDESWC